jgi:hypothetical protein
MSSGCEDRLVNWIIGNCMRAFKLLKSFSENGYESYSNGCVVLENWSQTFAIDKGFSLAKKLIFFIIYLPISIASRLQQKKTTTFF